MIQNPKIGDKVWKLRTYHNTCSIQQGKIMTVDDYPKLPGVKVVEIEFDLQIAKPLCERIFSDDCFPTLDSLLDDLRSRAIFLPKE